MTVPASSNRRAWAYAQYAVANASRHGVTAVEVGTWRWATDAYTLPRWERVADDRGSEVRVTVR